MFGLGLAKKALRAGAGRSIGGVGGAVGVMNRGVSGIRSRRSRGRAPRRVEIERGRRDGGSREYGLRGGGSVGLRGDGISGGGLRGLAWKHRVKKVRAAALEEYGTEVDRERALKWGGNHGGGGVIHRREPIPREVKIAVWRRDGGRCAMCGSTEDLQFDHIVPVAKGGTSKSAENIQLLCGRHNRKKSARIE